MSEKKSYFELLNHPKWQKKRLEILQAANFRCEDCASPDKPLHVHHSYYEKNLKPWDYPTQSLHCLCEDCHKAAQNINTLLKRTLGKIALSEHMQLFGYATGLSVNDSDENLLIEVLDYEFAEGVGNAWELSAEEVITHLREGMIDGATLEALRSAKRDVLKSKGVHPRRTNPKPRMR